MAESPSYDGPSSEPVSLRESLNSDYMRRGSIALKNNDFAEAGKWFKLAVAIWLGFFSSFIDNFFDLFFFCFFLPFPLLLMVHAPIIIFTFLIMGFVILMSTVCYVLYLYIDFMHR